MIVLNPQYESLRTWVENLPDIFFQQGEIIYDARNQIRRFEVNDGTHTYPVCVKCFHQPSFFKRLIYSTIRPTKAKRSYENALYLQQHQVATPEAIAYIETCRHGLLSTSFLITRQSALTRLNREFTLNYTPELDDTIRPLARFTAHMHNQGILHWDYSPGNILWDKVGDEYRFEIIDINRMRIGRPVSLKEGCQSLRRLCARTSFFRTFADEYAHARGFNPDECEKWILYYRNRFWKDGKKAHYTYD